MLYCPKCHVLLVDHAKFCHACGANVDIPLLVCSHCAKKNPADAPFCYECGQPLRALDLTEQYHSKFNLTFHKGKLEVEDEIKALFFHFLEQQVGFVNPKQYGLYLEHFYTKEFNATVGRRSRQMADEMTATFRLRGNSCLATLEKNLEEEMLRLALYHIVHNCADLNPVEIPRAVLKYDKAHVSNLNLAEMAFNYLDFESERLRIYTNLLNMPTEKLKNAAIQYLFAAKDEQIHFICDQSLLGTGKEGFAMTEFGLYWKSPLNKAQRVYFHQINKLEKHKDWITINKHFFNASEGMNIKMILLLDKLSRIY